MMRGSCLCGGVRYEVTGAFGPAIHCHCSQCRKASGSSFATNASVAASDFRIVAGEELLGRYESSPGQLRCFCSRCGSPVVKLYAGDVPFVRVRLGTLDDDAGIEVREHFHVGSKAPWTRILDDLPQHP
ncbi:MAG: GFA family protein [Myxococcales bacterium]|nr:GFA family protein [Myxococcales bacterium]